MYDDAPSLGETRAADPAYAPPATGRYPASAPGVDRASTIAAQATRSPRSAPMSGPVSGPNGATARFCGSCGARVTGAETFCGQCGKPLGNPSGAGVHGSSQPGPSARYQVGGWDDDSNAYTEALPESPTIAAAHNPYSGDPYARSYAPQYGSRSAMEAESGGMSRSTRMTLGVVFLAISIVLALGAIAALAAF